MGGALEELVGGPRLGHLAQVHHEHPLAEQAHHVQVVGDEEIAHPQAVLQVLQQVEDDRLDRDVQGRSGLVEDEQGGLQGDGPGDPHPRLLPARELVGEAREELPREAHHRGERLHALEERRAGPHAAQAAQGVGDGGEGRMSGVQALVRILEHHLDAGALLRADEAARRHRSDVLPFEINDARGRVVQPRDKARQGGFAAARLPHQPQALPPFELEGHSVHRVEPVPVRRLQALPPQSAQGALEVGNRAARLHGELLGQVPDFQQAHPMGFQQPTRWPGASSRLGRGPRSHWRA